MRWPWVILFLSFLTAFLGYGIRNGCYPVLIPDMRSTFVLGYAQTGLLFTFFYVAYMVFSPIVGTLSDIVGCRRIIGAFSTLLGIGAVLMSLSPSITIAYLCSFLMGIGASACFTPLVGLLSTWFGQKRGTAIGLALVGGGLGTAVMGLGLPWLVSVYDWRFGWLLLGCVTIITGALNWLLIREAPSADRRIETPSSISKDQKSLRRLRSILLNPAFLLVALSYFFLSFDYYIGTSFLPAYAESELGFQKVLSSALMSFYGFGAIAGSLILPTMSDRFGRKRTAIMATLLFGSMNLGFALVKSYAGLVLFSFLFGMFGWGAVGTYATLAGEYFPQAWTGTVMGIWTFFYGLAASVSPPIAGYVVDISKTFLWAFVLALVAGLLSTILLLPLGKGLKSHSGSKGSAM